MKISRIAEKVGARGGAGSWLSLHRSSVLAVAVGFFLTAMVAVSPALASTAAEVSQSVASPAAVELQVFAGHPTPSASLRGRVVDSDGAPVVGAEVVVEGQGRQAVTDREGRFEILGLRAGTFRLHVTGIGFAPVVVDAVVPGSGALEIVLDRTPLRLPGLQVTATPGGADVRAVAQATTELSGAALERRRSATLAQTLEREPGIAVRYNGPAASAPMIRGLTGDRILVLQDGQRTGDLSGSADDHATTVDPLAASRIEVVRGPAALLYGNNALGGVVNVVSNDVPLDRPSRVQGVLSGQAESVFAGGGLSALITAPVGERWTLTVRGGARETGDVRIGGDPVLGDRIPNTGMSARHGVAGLGYSGDRVRVGGAVRAYSFGYGIPTPPDAEPMEWEGERLEGVVRLESELPFSRFPALHLDATAQSYAHDEGEIGGDAANRFELSTQSATARLDQAPFGRLGRGSWGVSGLRKSYTGTGEAALTPPADSRAIGVFAFQQIALGAGGRGDAVGALPGGRDGSVSNDAVAALQLGARVDRYVIEAEAAAGFGPGRERVFDAFSGSVGLVAPLGHALTGSLTLARAFRAPTVEELFSSSLHAGTGAVEYGNADLDAERSLGLDAVLRLHSGRLSGQLAAYRNRIAGYIYPSVVGDTIVGGATFPVVTYAQADAVLRGVEGSLEVALTEALVAGAGGDLIQAELEGGAPLPFLPPARVNAELRWDDGRWSLGAGARHAFARTRVSEDDETPTDAYTLVDLEAALRLPIRGAIHSITLAVDNLTDALYRDATSRIKDFAPNPGRNVRIGYRVTW